MKIDQIFMKNKKTAENAVFYFLFMIEYIYYYEST